MKLLHYKSTHTCFAILGFIASLLNPVYAATNATSEQTNEANSPLTPKITVNFHNYYQNLYHVDDDADTFMLRTVVPTKILDTVHLFRATLPLVLAPEIGGGQVFGMGDLTITDFIPFKAEGIEFGIGPQLTFPTATRDETGTGKWQAGVAGLVLKPMESGLLGVLVTWQGSFAGPSNRPTQNNLSVQPLLLYNLPEGWYLRSTAICNFQLNEDHNYTIPVGAGVGKVFVLSGGTTVNAFVEPQWTVAHDGDGTPQFQLFIGCNLQFPIHVKH